MFDPFLAEDGRLWFPHEEFRANWQPSDLSGWDDFPEEGEWDPAEKEHCQAEEEDCPAEDLPYTRNSTPLQPSPPSFHYDWETSTWCDKSLEYRSSFIRSLHHSDGSLGPEECTAFTEEAPAVTATFDDFHNEPHNSHHGPPSPCDQLAYFDFNAFLRGNGSLRATYNPTSPPPDPATETSDFEGEDSDWETEGEQAASAVLNKSFFDHLREHGNESRKHRHKCEYCHDCEEECRERREDLPSSIMSGYPGYPGSSFPGAGGIPSPYGATPEQTARENAILMEKQHKFLARGPNAPPLLNAFGQPVPQPAYTPGGYDIYGRVIPSSGFASPQTAYSAPPQSPYQSPPAQSPYQPPPQAQPDEDAQPPPQPRVTVTTTGNPPPSHTMSFNAFLGYDRAWGKLTPTSPDLPIPHISGSKESLFQDPRNVVHYGDVLPGTHWTPDALIVANTQLFFIRAFGLSPFLVVDERSLVPKVQIGAESETGLVDREKVETLSKQLKLEKTRWHSDRMKMRGVGVDMELVRGVFQGVSELCSLCEEILRE